MKDIITNLKIKTFVKFICLCVVLMSCQNQQKPENYSHLVNPFIGTDGPGNTYPGATVPFGMVQLSPDIGIEGWDRIAGYFYQDSIISGFSHTHLSGTGAGDLYDISVMPTNSKFNKRIKENKGMPFSLFSHKDEHAEAGYYQVRLLSYDINVELTATEHVGIQRYDFPKDSLSKINVDLGFSMNWDAPTNTYIKVIDSTTIEGMRQSTGWAKDQRVYFVMQFSKPFKSYMLYKDKELTQLTEIQDIKTRFEALFPTDNREKIVVKTALSSASIQGAYTALEKEASHFDFDKYKNDAQHTWNQELGKIVIETDNPDEKSLFYTMLYQSMLAPTLLSDAQGYYKAPNGNIQKSTKFKRYDTFSLWDTFRAAHPLFTIIHRERSKDFIASLLAHYKEAGTLPVWSMYGNETHMMIGYHAVPVIVDAYFKGIPMDTCLAYEACKTSATTHERDIDVYEKLGYVPADNSEGENWSVSKTLEYAYDDWCISQFAKDLGKTADAEYFAKRSENWRNLFDSKSTFIRPKNSDGNFVSPFTAKQYTPYYCESNAWHYFWYVPHNINGLIESLGGKERFEQKLDSMFTYAPSSSDKLPIFSTGMIGQYAHGNEPSHHIAYLYNYIGKPHKTQQRVRQILLSQYKNAPDGHCGNEDCGQMSAWYVLSSLGFYPVNPADGNYALGVPLFRKATIFLSNGKKFTIEMKNFSPDCFQVETILLNNKPLKNNTLRHKDIENGGHLVFVMKKK